MIREYERFSTVAVNAFVGPQSSMYLRNLEAKVKDAGIPAKLRVVQSNGGISTIVGCAKKPVGILMSGPAGGVIGALSEARLAGTENILTVDIGGTSADISTIADGQFRIKNPRDTIVSGHAVMAPMIDLETIGAGGGSIAYLDAAGGFNVGPRSAGSQPGPACYNRGGTEPTVTDAQVVLGRMDADKFLGGDLLLDPQLSHDAIKTKIADPLGISVNEAALGIIKIVNNNMALTIRSNSVARGYDPRDFSFMPFGGAGPFHGTALAELVSARDVLVPLAPGITAAMGLLGTDLQYEHTRSVITNLFTADQASIDKVNAVSAKLSAMSKEVLDSDDIPTAERAYEVIAEVRYRGQTLPVHVCVRVIHDRIEVDLIGSAPQTPTAYNVPFEGSTKVAAFAAFRKLLLDTATSDTRVPSNQGSFRPIDVIAPKGSIFNPKTPASAEARFTQCNMMIDLIMKAMAPVLPDEIIAGSFASISFASCAGVRPSGEYWVFLEVNEGAYGGCPQSDGPDSIDNLMANTRNNPLEDLVMHIPMICERYELRATSCAMT